MIKEIREQRVLYVGHGHVEVVAAGGDGAGHVLEEVQLLGAPELSVVPDVISQPISIDQLDWKLLQAGWDWKIWLNESLTCLCFCFKPDH